VTIRARGLSARIPERWLFRGLDLAAEPGRIWSLVGPNGSGKSTLLRCLAGLRAPDEGEVFIDQQPLTALRGPQRAVRVAYLPQLTPLYHDLEVHQLVMLGRAPHLSRWRGPSAEDQHRVERSLERVWARDLAGRRVSTLSGGERQRVMLARLLATDATVLLLDEPTTSLDIGHALRLLDLCRTLADDGAAIILAMHELDLARRVCDHAVCLGAGASGEHHRGPVADVLTPEILGTVFDVEVHEHADGLSFHPR